MLVVREMSDHEKLRYIHWRNLNDFAIAALVRVGVTPEDAVVVADTMIEADLRGVDTHGIANMLVPNVRMICDGNMNPRPRLTIVKETPVTVLMDADDGIGNLVSVKAMGIAIDKARDSGVCLVGVRNSTHCGAMAYYPMMALQHDMIGFMTVNSAPVVPAYGGVTRLLSTNPYAAAVPAGEELPVVIDMAVTVSAQSKVLFKYRLGEKIPLGWGLNRFGEPTEDPADVLYRGGFLAWTGGAKGYALSVLANILSGVLTGSPFGNEDFPPYTTAGHGSQKITEGHFLAAFRIDYFMPVAEFKERMDAMIRETKASKPAKGFDRVYLPGEPEFIMKEKRLQTGIPISQPIWERLVKMREDLELDFKLE